jgi:hypothetical protein
MDAAGRNARRGSLRHQRVRAGQRVSGFGEGVLTFREFLVQEPLPLATVQGAVLEFLRNRDDVVVFGAQAVNAYVDEPRMTQDIDLISTRAEGVAQELSEYLHRRFGIAVRVRRVADGRGPRLFQVRKTGNRHLVDVETLPQAERIGGVLVMAPADLIASKVIAFHQRRGQPRSGTDWRDLALLLLTFPALKDQPGEVNKRLRAAGVGDDVLAAWGELAGAEIRRPDEDDEF